MILNKSDWLVALQLVLLASGGTVANAALQPDQVKVAIGRKTQNYLKDGIITGGDRAVDQVNVKDIRRGGSSQGYERIVIDLEGNHGGEPVAIPRPPYYQVAVSPEERRIVFTVWGRPNLSFNSSKVLSGFKSSRSITSVEILPRLEEDSWTFVMNLRGPRPVEVFELGQPARVILDIKLDPKQDVAVAPAAPKVANKPAAHSSSHLPSAKKKVFSAQEQEKLLEKAPAEPGAVDEVPESPGAYQ